MPFCAGCGTVVTDSDRFCAKCGRPVEAAVPISGAEAGMPQNIAAALCYLIGPVTGVLFLVIDPYRRDPLIRFHAMQSILVGVAWFVFWVLVMMVFRGVGFFLAPIVSLGFLVLWIFLIAKTYQKQKVVLPVIGRWAEQQAASFRIG